MTRDWRDAALALYGWMAEREFRGYDPFDGALSPLARPLAVSRWAMVAWTQLHRRLPLQLRPVLGIRPHVNPKTPALAIQGHLRLAAGEGLSAEVREGHREEVRRLAGILQELRGKEGGWGYPFRWANRHFSVPAGTPASVPTAFAVHALMDAAEDGAEDEARVHEAAEAAARLLAEGLNRIEVEGGFLLSYTPLDHRGVHNASLLSASVLARVGRRMGDASLLEAASGAVGAALRAQRPDGSWPYGITRRDAWVDPYHTGYILTALRSLRSDLGRPGLGDALSRGFEYWRSEFLQGPAVAPRPGGAWPVDAHALAQGILTLREFEEEWSEARTAAVRLGAWALDNLARGDGSYAFCKGRVLSNRIPYMRWVQAWMFVGLSELAAWEEG